MHRLILCLALVCAGAAAQAQAISEAALAAIRATEGDAWDTAYSLAPANDPVARDVITWLRLRAGADDFEDYRAFVVDRADWPGLDRIRARGEEVLPKGTPPVEVLIWFGDLDPETGEGAVRLAEALYARGLPDLARAAVEEAWLDLRLTDAGQEAIVGAFPDLIAPHHAERIDNLLWRWRTDEATRMLPLLTDEQRALAEARIAYIRKSGDLTEKLSAVPLALKDHPGLAYDRYNWLADRGYREQAVALVLERSTSAEALGEPFRWSGWRRSLARWEMRQGRAERAYQVASQHFLTEGSSYADLEWIAGYVSLRYLGDPVQALAHFLNADAAVRGPISEARMAYWTAQAQNALGETVAATASLQKAAQHQTAFYGLLASEALGLSLDPALTGRADATDWQNGPLMDVDLVRAGLMLLEAGERGAAVPFFVELGKTLGADDLSRLAAYVLDKDEPYFAVLLGKTAVTQGNLVPSVYFPLHPLAQMDLPAPPALSLSIARRESEFNAGVGSPVGALGLMQLMPATAEEVAGFLDLPYSRNRLTADWEYNAQLGAKYLSVLEEQFGPSPVQIAAGYNAGPSRPELWMDERGDPRLGEIDVVDWIELIPFRETRNYVMRVTESIPIYEARLTGRTGPVRFRAMLNGVKPNPRPEMRPAGLGVPEPPLRPVARP